LKCEGSPPLIRISGLTVLYQANWGEKPALDRFDLVINNGEIVGLMGPSGCGKTTVVLSVLGLLPPTAAVTAGSIQFLGQDLLNLNEKIFRKIRGREIGVVFQEPGASLNPVMKIGSQLCEGMRWHLKISRKEARERALDLLEETGIQDPASCLEAYPHQLSGGMQQRVLIASAVACRPRLLICDEPTSALDMIVQTRVLDLLKRLQKKMDLSILLISHDLLAIERIASRIETMA